jgi:hypothetical protein
VTETRVHLEQPSTNTRALESVLLGHPRRWIPIRRTGPYTTYWIVEAWFVAVALAMPTALLWRRRKRETARGFEVQASG